MRYILAGMLVNFNHNKKKVMCRMRIEVRGPDEIAWQAVGCRPLLQPFG